MKFTLNPRNRLLAASRILSSVGIDLQTRSVALEATKVRIAELDVLGRDEAQSVLDVLTSLGSFDDVVRDQIKEVRTAERYEEVRSTFKSILDDAERMVNQVSEKGKINLLEKIQNKVLDWRRGSIQSRFQHLRNISEQVFADVDEQIQREMKILGAYSEFRVALKESTLVAEFLKNKGQERKTQYADALTVAQEQVDEGKAANIGVMALGQLELARDEAKRSFDTEDRRYQTALDVSEQLTIAYATSEAVMTKLAQTTHIKDAQQRKSTTFYTANSGVLTALTVAFTSMKELHEGTQNQQNFVDGTNNALDLLATLGTNVQEQAIKVTYGATIDSKAIKKLFDSAVEFEIKQRGMIEQLRETSKANHEAVRLVLEEGQRKMADAVSRRAGSAADNSLGASSSIEMSTQAPELAAEQPSYDHKVELKSIAASVAAPEEKTAVTSAPRRS